MDAGEQTGAPDNRNMISESAAAGQVIVRGVVARITFRNETNGYTVARIRRDGQEQLLTAVGHFPSLQVGESMSFTGEWTHHPEYGRQLQVEEYEPVTPNTLTGIQRYLASGLIKGVGPALAERLVAHFGLDTLHVIEHKPQRLGEVEGIGPKKLQAIVAGLERQRAVQKVMVFLQGYGVSAAFAARIYREYGDDAIQRVQENPYRLAQDIFGMGFKMADRLAQAMGLDAQDPQRLAAGVEYVLREAGSQGHVYLPAEVLIQQAAEALEVDPADLQPVIADLTSRGRLRAGEGDEHPVYLPDLHGAEVGVAQRLAALVEAAPAPVGGNLTDEDPVQAAEAESRLQLSPSQRQAVEQALESGVLVITGGPGTGKTTIVHVLLHCLQGAGLKVLLACPTGRAAQRLKEATGQNARTIHRLLEFGYGDGRPGFQRNDERPLEADVVIIDEASMVDLWLMHHLMRALRPGTRLVLVGDVDQLPPVGPGNVLLDVIKSGVVPVVRLTDIFRQAQESLIVVNAHRINQGEEPVLNDRKRDFFFIEEDDPEQIVEQIRTLAARRLPSFLRCDPVQDIQVLSPMRRTVTGVENLNQVLQAALNPPLTGKAEVRAGAHILRAGDKVMQIRNNYRKMVFNGDIGRVVVVDPEETRVTVSYPEAEGVQMVDYDAGEWHELVPAFCISVHKSQGSEYPAVVVPVSTQHYVMLQRNLLYTAVTRAKRLVVLVGTKRALGIALRNSSVAARYSLLSERLQGGIHL